MEIYQCLEILRKENKKFLFKKDSNLDKKLLALNQLAEIGSANLIDALIPFLRDNSKAIRLGTIETIRILFNTIESKKDYQRTLRYCPIATTDFNYFERKFNRENHILLLQIASLNNNGFVREKAVLKLGELLDGSSLPFVIFRLADWIPNIRKSAKQVLRQFKKSEFVPILIDNLTLFQWLEKVNRTNLSPILSEIMSFLIDENREIVLKKIKSTAEKERRILVTHLIDKLDNSEEFDLIIEDKSFLIRPLVLHHFDKLSEVQKATLLNDKASKVRLSTLYQYKSTTNFKDLLIDFIADKSGSIRTFARFYLKDAEIDFIAFYTNNLIQNKQVVGSILGLLDLDARNSTQCIIPYLQHEKVRIVKTAFYVLSNLDMYLVYDFAKNNLFTNRMGLRNSIINYFGTYPTTEIKTIARTTYKESNDDNLKLSMLKLFSKFGGYPILPDLIIGTIDDSEIIRNQAIEYIRNWKNQGHIRPTEAERQRGIKILNLANEIYQSKNSFEKNPVKDLEFWLME